MHAKPPQDGTTRAVLWLEAIKTRCTGGPVAEGVMTQRTKPPFRADHVGSLLRTAPLKEARAKHAKGEISADALKTVEDREIAAIIRKQEDVGLKAVTDGEFRRAFWNYDFLGRLDGVEVYLGERKIRFQGVNPKPMMLRVIGKLGSYSPHPMIEHFKFVAAHTKRAPKITIPAPSAAYGRPMRTPIDQKAYPKLDALFEDLGQAYKKTVRAFADAGCRYLQLDEVFIAMLCDPKYRQAMKDRGDDPEKLGELYGDLINIAMSDIPSDMTITMHMCRGNYKSTFMGAGGYDAVQEILFGKINVHDVADRIWIHRAQFRVSLDVHILQKLPDLRIFEPLRLELAIGDFVVNQRNCRDIRQTVVCSLPRFRCPFLRFAPDDVD